MRARLDAMDEDRIRREVGTSVLQAGETQVLVAEVLEMDPTHLSRIVNAKRTSHFERFARDIVKLALDPRTKAWPLVSLVKTLAMLESRMADMSARQRIHELMREEQVAQAAFDLLEVPGELDLDDADAVKDAIVKLGRQASETEELMGAMIQHLRTLDGTPGGQSTGEGR